MFLETMEAKKHKSETKGHDLQMQCWKTLVWYVRSRQKDLVKVGREMIQARIEAEQCTCIWRLGLGRKWGCHLIVL